MQLHLKSWLSSVESKEHKKLAPLKLPGGGYLITMGE